MPYLDCSYRIIRSIQRAIATANNYLGNYYAETDPARAQSYLDNILADIPVHPAVSPAADVPEDVDVPSWADREAFDAEAPIKPRAKRGTAGTLPDRCR